MIIKFRFWDSIKKNYLYCTQGEVFYGYLFNHIKYPEHYRGMYSNFNDKNNQEIYEGDIIELINEHGVKIQVVCKSGRSTRAIQGKAVDIIGFYFEHKDGFHSFPIVNNYLNKHDTDLFEIIGNIYNDKIN